MSNVDSQNSQSEDDQSQRQRNKVNYHLLPQSRKIFVGGLPDGITDEQFEAYFSQFGALTDHVIIHNKETKKPRGFGFVSFDSDEAVERVLTNPFHYLNNKQVQVIKAKPKQANNVNTIITSGPNDLAFGLEHNYVPPQPQYSYYHQAYDYYHNNIYYYAQPVNNSFYHSNTAYNYNNNQVAQYDTIYQQSYAYGSLVYNP